VGGAIAVDSSHPMLSNCTFTRNSAGTRGGAMFNEAFSPRRIDAMDDFVEGTARKLMDAFIQDGFCDWVKQMAVPLPLIVIGKQVGVPEEDIWKIKAMPE